MHKLLKFVFRGGGSQVDILRKIFSKIFFNHIKDKFLVVKLKSCDCYLLLDCRDEFGINVVKFGRIETPEDKFIPKILKKGDIVLDIGAHWGGFSVCFANLVGNEGKVFSFEPSSKNYRILRKNIQINKLSNIEVSKYAVGDKEDFVKLKIASTSSGHNSIARDNLLFEKEEVVKQIKIDKFLKEKEIKNINFIKIDVEGYELEVLKGMKETIRNQNNFWMFLEYSPVFMDKEKALELLEFLMENFTDVYIGNKGQIYKTDWEEVKELSFEKGQRNLFLYKS
jgi:FkbM family methyltransferase